MGCENLSATNFIWNESTRRLEPSLPGGVPVVGLLVAFGLDAFGFVPFGLMYTEEALLGTYEIVGEIDAVARAVNI